MSKSKFSDDPIAKHFQIRFTDKDGCGSFYCFSAMPKEDIGQKAADIANVEYLEKGYQNSFFGTFKPLKSAWVVQYDRNTKEAMRGGIKFKIRLSFVQATYTRGRKERTEWYVADEIKEKVK